MTITYYKGINNKKEPVITRKYGSILKFFETIDKIIDDLIKECEEEFHEDNIAT